MKDNQFGIYKEMFVDRTPVIHPITMNLEEEEFVKFLLGWILKGVYHTTKTELTILSYIYLYGKDAVNKVVENEILSSKKTVENYISKFRKDGVVVGIREKTQLHPNINIIDSNNISFIIKVNKNEKMAKK